MSLLICNTYQGRDWILAQDLVKSLQTILGRVVVEKRHKPQSLIFSFSADLYYTLQCDYNLWDVFYYHYY